MSFKPTGQRDNAGGDYVQRNYPEPKSGMRRARLSMIVDLGVQDREPGDDGKDKTPKQHVAMYADLVNDVVDYGGDIGKQHYRLQLNSTYMGKFKGIGFFGTPPKDADGNTIKGKAWGLHDNSMITKLAKAIGKPEVQDGNDMDISKLLNGQFMALVDVNKKPSGKLDGEGNEIIYTNVNFKTPSPVAPVMKTITDEDGNEEEVEEMPVFAALKAEPKCITFENATKDDIKFIRANVLKIIKLAHNYAGSNMQKAIEAFEAENGKGEAPAEGKVAPKAEAKPAAKPAAKKVEPKPAPDFDDSDIPF